MNGFTMSPVNFPETYELKDEYQSIKERANKVLVKYLGYPGLIMFNDLEKSVTFSSERLIPTTSTNRPRIMLLFSNPHPHSIHQGMFLSPNTLGQENLFWPVMEEAGWLPIPKENRTPKQLAEICLEVEYPGPFELIFYCYYSFPTDYPEDIKKIFGKEYFNRKIEPDALKEFMDKIKETDVEAIVTFNKEIFNLVSKIRIDRYIDRLSEGEHIQSRINGIDRHVPIFLTYPTGWRYNKNYKQLRIASLVAIRNAICSGLDVPGSANL